MIAAMRERIGMKKKVCVIGGAGYVGSRLVPALLNKGYVVIVIDPCWFGNHLPASVKIIKKDVLHVPAEFFKGYDAVIFLAGLASDPMAEFAHSFNFVSNLGAPAYAAFAARQAGVKRFIFADSCSVYGDAKGKVRSESDALSFLPYPYGVSKAQATRSLMYLVSQSFSVITLRKGTISGWSPRMRFDLLVNTMYRSAAAEGVIRVSNPQIVRPLLPIEDAVAAYINALEAPRALSGIFNIASTNVTVGEVGKEVQQHFASVHGREVKLDMQNIPDVRNYGATIAQAKHKLRFKPHGTVASILTELDAHVGPDFDFSPDRYYNLRVFKKIFKKVSHV